MTDSRQMDLTEGSVAGKLLRFALPFLLSNLLQAFYNVADMLIVGNFNGTSAISAVNIGGQVMQIISSLITGITIGGTVLVAQYKGAGLYDETKRTVSTMFTLSVVIGLVMMVLSFIVTKPILRLIGTPEEAFDDAVSYLRVCTTGVVFIFLYNGISSIMRGLGDSTRPLYFIFFSTCMNVVLDLILVGVCGLSVFGAAVATVASQISAVVLAIIYLRKTDFIFDFRPRSFRIDGKIAKRVLAIGLPSSVQMTINSFSRLFITSLVNSFSLAASAASGIGAKIDSFALMPSLAVQSAASSMTGQNIGAKKYDRVYQIFKCALLTTLTIATVIFIVCQIFPEAFFRAFLSDPNAAEAAETIRIGRIYMSIVPFSYFGFAVMFIINGITTGSGNTLFTLLNSTINIIAIRIPLAYLLSKVLGFGLEGVYWAIVITPIGGSIAGLAFFLSKRWQKSKVSKV